MAKQPEDLVVRILRDIQRTLADRTHSLADHTRQFEELKRGFNDVNDGTVNPLKGPLRLDVLIEQFEKMSSKERRHSIEYAEAELRAKGLKTLEEIMG
jgi:hypothetical protein